jgi:hypothetical protein
MRSSRVGFSLLIVMFGGAVTILGLGLGDNMLKRAFASGLEPPLFDEEWDLANQFNSAKDWPEDYASQGSEAFDYGYGDDACVSKYHFNDQDLQAEEDNSRESGDADMNIQEYQEYAATDLEVPTEGMVVSADENAAEFEAEFEAVDPSSDEINEMDATLAEQEMGLEAEAISDAAAYASQEETSFEDLIAQEDEEVVEEHVVVEEEAIAQEAQEQILAEEIAILEQQDLEQQDLEQQDVVLDNAVLEENEDDNFGYKIAEPAEQYGDQEKLDSETEENAVDFFDTSFPREDTLLPADEDVNPDLQGQSNASSLLDIVKSWAKQSLNDLAKVYISLTR